MHDYCGRTLAQQHGAMASPKSQRKGMVGLGGSQKPHALHRDSHSVSGEWFAM